MGRRWAICFSGRIPSWDESARCLSNSFRNCCLGCIGAYSTQLHGHYHQPYKEIMRSLLAWMQCISSSLLPSRAVVVSPGIPPKHWNILTSSRSWPSGPPFSRARAGRQHHRTAELSVFAAQFFVLKRSENRHRPPCQIVAAELSLERRAVGILESTMDHFHGPL